jgi:pheromone shutdown protein TraB
VRNLRQATHIVDLAATGRPERVLVVVGAAHKASIERVLATQLTVRLVQLEEQDGVGGPRRY